ncbi:MAG: sugar ABC transporter ATP-binding protein [Deltaproteobacteria bacterium]|nr:sugar ABC transporter ATP-binding protein [Deltaproteobacteria bacterium]
MQEGLNTTANETPLLKLENISKRFPGGSALYKVDFDLREGEVHVLFGENGAGKSTLINIVAGALRPTTGRILYRGQETHFPNVHSARENGVHAVFQEFSLIPQLTVTQNLFLGVEKGRYGFLDKKIMHQQAQEILDRLGFELDPRKKIIYLTRAEQQMVEIAKVFGSDLSVLILDEPTASLTEKETERLFALIEQARNDNVGIIYITHRMGEIRRISDRITILRDGNYIATVKTDRVTDNELVELMTGRVIDQIFPTIHYNPRETILSVHNMTTVDNSVKNVSLEFKRGEIVGMAGLVGSGKSKVMRACFGIEEIKSGEIIFEDKKFTNVTPAKMLDIGMFYIPPDRRNEGLVMMRNVRENITLAALPLFKLSLYSMFLKRKNERVLALDLSQRLNLQPLKIERSVDLFSGGNQQKTLLAKVLTRKTKLFIFDEPTVGVDVGTRAAIYEFIGDLCRQGAAIVLISSDLPEILHLTNRAYVFYRGDLRAELKGEEITEQNVLFHFFEQKAA